MNNQTLLFKNYIKYDKTIKKSKIKHKIEEGDYLMGKEEHAAGERDLGGFLVIVNDPFLNL